MASNESENVEAEEGGDDGSKKESKGKKKKKGEVDLLSDTAIDNVYCTCHNVQEFLQARGYFPPGYVNKKKKKK